MSVKHRRWKVAKTPPWDQYFPKHVLWVLPFLRPSICVSDVINMAVSDALGVGGIGLHLYTSFVRSSYIMSCPRIFWRKKLEKNTPQQQHFVSLSLIKKKIKKNLISPRCENETLIHWLNKHYTLCVCDLFIICSLLLILFVWWWVHISVNPIASTERDHLTLIWAQSNSGIQIQLW